MSCLKILLLAAAPSRPKRYILFLGVRFNTRLQKRLHHLSFVVDQLTLVAIYLKIKRLLDNVLVPADSGTKGSPAD